MLFKSGIGPVYNRLDIFVNDPAVRLSVLNDEQYARDYFTKLSNSFSTDGVNPIHVGVDCGDVFAASWSGDLHLAFIYRVSGPIGSKSYLEKVPGVTEPFGTAQSYGTDMSVSNRDHIDFARNNSFPFLEIGNLADGQTHQGVTSMQVISNVSEAISRLTVIGQILSNLKSAKDVLTTNVLQLNNQVTGLNEQITALQNDLASGNTNADSLQATINALQSQAANLQNTIDSQAANFASLFSSIDVVSNTADVDGDGELTSSDGQY